MSRPPDREPLLESQDTENQASSSNAPESTVSQRPTAVENEEETDGVLFELAAQRVVTWTIWFLLAAVLIGTVIGVVLVCLDMQNGDPPPAIRKSAALMVLRGGPETCGWGQCPEDQQILSSRFLNSNTGAGNSSSVPAKAVVWSGKGRGKRPVFNDLHTFDLNTNLWETVFNLSVAEGEGLHYPAPRWKALTLFDPRSRDMIVFGGDPLEANGEFLNDLWRFKQPLPRTNNAWERITSQNSSDEGPVLPSARRAHAGVILDWNGTSTLVIHGGKQQGGGLLDDLWSTPLDSESTAWECRSCEDDPEGDSIAQETSHSSRKGHKKRKKKKHRWPLARKGHAAFALPDPESPKMVIWGGRNDTGYFQDMWAFDLIMDEWEEWYVPPDAPQPAARDHLAGFAMGGSLYIFGGRGGDTYNDSLPFDDMWAFDVSNRRWSEIRPEGAKPLPRFLHSTDVYAAKGNTWDTRLVVFGGESLKHCYLNDLWEFHLATRQWVERSSPEFDKKKCAKLAETRA